MIKAYRIFVWLFLCGLLGGIAPAATFHLANGQTISGDIISMDGTGIILKQPDGSYADRLPWSKLSQADLRELDQNNPKAAQFVEPFIEPSVDENKTKRAEVEIKDFPRLPRSTGHSLFGALFTSPMGIFLMLMLYAANLYAAYEVALFRGHPVGLVCGVSAVVPIIGPIIFLAMPTKMKKKEASWQTADQHLDEGVAAVIAAEQATPAEVATAEAAAQAAQAAPAQPAAPSLPPPKIFARGQFTFNRRFFETQMPAFFAMTRPEAEKDKVLQVKSARGLHLAQRISRISATELFLQIQKGEASEEVLVPFVEIQEVQIRHKDYQDA